MKTAIFCFSGSGNTRKVAQKYQECIMSRGHGCDVFSIPLNTEIDYDEYDIIGIGYPVHAFNAPQPVLQFANSLPNKSKKVFLFKTSGEPVKMNRISSIKLKNILKSRGWDVTNEYHYCMPYNMIFRHTDHMAYKMWETAKKLIPLDCSEIFAGIERHEEKVPFGALIAWVMRIEHGGAHFNGLFYKADDKCIGCGKCVRNCPVCNIEMKDGKPLFGDKCTMCTACSFNCPTNSIKIGLFNSWKVNGAYSFEDGDPLEKNGHENYCKKAYERYFREAEERISGVAATEQSQEDAVYDT